MEIQFLGDEGWCLYFMIKINLTIIKKMIKIKLLSLSSHQFGKFKFSAYVDSSIISISFMGNLESSL